MGGGGGWYAEVSDVNVYLVSVNREVHSVGRFFRICVSRDIDIDTDIGREVLMM